MVSNEFINECKNRANSNRLGQLIVDEMDNPITQSDKLQSFTIDSGCYVDGNIIGSVYVKKLTGKILDSANVSLVDKTIQAKIGVKYIDNSTEYLNIGKYNIERPTSEKTVNMSEFTAYNGLINKLDDKYVCNIDYSKGNITLTDLYKDVCSQMNLTPTTITFDNSSIPISANPFTNGEKNRTVLQVIAKIAGSWIEIDDDSNEVDLHWLSQNSEPDYIFNLNDYSTVEGGEITCGPINCLIIKNSQVDDENITITDDESIALYGENSIVINEDYILYNSNLRQQAINAIWNKVHGLNYVDCKLITYYGKPFLKLGDKIRIYTSETEYFDTYVLKHNFTYDGTFTSTIESPVLTKQEVKNKQNISLGELLKNTRIDLNKQEQKINLAVETAQEAYDKVEVYNPVLESTGNGQLQLQDSAGEDLLEFTVDGKSVQETSTEGTNKFDDSVIKGTTLPTSAGTMATQIPIKNKLKDNTNYYVHLFINGTVWKGNRISFSFYDSNNNKLSEIATSTQILNLSNLSTATYMKLYINASGVSEYGGQSITGLVISESADTSYSEFIPNSPSPEYPSEIKSISGVENLFDKDNVISGIFYNVSNGSIINATMWTQSDFIEVKSNEDYTLSSSYLDIYSSFEITQFDSSNNWIKSIQLTLNGAFKITTESNTKYMKVGFRNDRGIEHIQLELGSIANDYVPYGSNYLIEKVVGKNKFDKDNANILSGYLYQTQDKILAGGNNKIIYIPCKKNTTYTITKGLQTTTSANRFKIATTNEIPAIGVKVYNFVNGGSDGTTTTELTITTDENSKYIVAFIYAQDGAMTLEELLSTIQIEEGSQATEYEEYKEVISLIDLKGNKLCSIGDIKDKLIIKDGQATIDKKIEEVVLDGTNLEFGYIPGNSNETYSQFNSYPISDMYVSSRRNNALMSHFKYEASASNSTKNGFGFQLHPNKFIVFSFPTKLLTAGNELNSFKTWLSNNPVTMDYELITPQTIDLGEVSIQTLQSDCTLELEEELDTNMYAKYIKNNPYNEAYSTRLDTKAQIQLSENKIESSVSETILQNTELMQGEIDSLSSNLANNYMTSEEVQNLNNLTNESLAVITNEFKQVQTSTQTQFQAITNILQNGVSLVKTTYITIDGEGLKIAKSTDSFNGVLDNKNLRFYSYENLMSVYSNKGAGFTNLLVTGQADIAYSKIMKVTQNGKKYTGIFYSDAMAQTLEDFIGE